MKKTIGLVFLVCLMSTPTWASDEKAVIQSLEKLITKMVALGSTTLSEPYQTAEGWRIKKWDDSTRVDVKYDIKKTDSIISPYLGIVTFVARMCVTDAATEAGMIKGKFDCIKMPGGDMITEYTFAYQGGKWEMKGARSQLPLLKSMGSRSAGWTENSNHLDFVFNKESILKLQA